MTPVRTLQQWVRRSPYYKWWAAAAVGTITALEVAHFGAVNVAQPNIADRFGSDLPTVQWVTLGHLLAISVLLLPMGRVSDMVGRKRIFVWGMLAFIAGTALAGTATSLPALIFFRVLQGIGPAMIIANEMAIMTSLFPDRERGTALGVHMMAVGLGLVIGPAIGGLLIGALGWRYVFLAFVPLGLLALIPFLLVVDESHLRQGGARAQNDTFDWPGAATSTLALLLFLLAVSNGHRLGWESPFVLGGLALSVVSLGAFVWWELRTDSPMMELRLFKSQMFSIAVAARTIFFITGAAPIFLMPFYLLGVAGYSAVQAGFIMAAMALSTTVTGPVGGWLTDRFGWKPVALGGAAVSGLGLLLLAQLTATTPLTVIVVLLMVQSSSYALFNLPISSAILGAVERSRHSVVSAFLQLLRNTFTVTGIAVTTLIVTATMASKGLEPSLAIISEAAGTKEALAFTSGMRITFLTMAALQLAAMVLLVGKGRWIMGPIRSGAAKLGVRRSLPG